MYQAEDYQSLNSQSLICLQLILKSQGWEWLTVTRFPVVFDRLATTTEHGILRLQELCGSLLATVQICTAKIKFSLARYLTSHHALSYRLRTYNYAAELPVSPAMPKFQASKLRLREFCEGQTLIKKRLVFSTLLIFVFFNSKSADIYVKKLKCPLFMSTLAVSVHSCAVCSPKLPY